MFVEDNRRRFLREDLPDLETKSVPWDLSSARIVQVSAAPSPPFDYRFVTSMRAEKHLLFLLL